MLLLIFITSCTSVKDTSEFKPIPRKKDELAELKSTVKAKNSVVLLLPLSGANKTLGKNILNACILGNESPDIDFYVIDTLSCPENLKQNSFHNLRFVIGPVFFKEIHKFASVFQDVPILALSNNTDADNSHIYACGLSPKEEIKTIFRYIKRNKIESIAVLLPQGEFFKNILEFIQKEATNEMITEENINVVQYNEISSENATEFVRANQGKAIFIFQPLSDMDSLQNTPIFTLSSLVLSNPEKWKGVMFAYADNNDQNEFIETYQKKFGELPNVISFAAYDLINAISESLSSKESIFEKTYEGLLGKFQLRKGKSISRDLEIFKIENNEKVKIERES